MNLEDLGLNYYITTLFLFIFLILSFPVFAGEGQEVFLINYEESKDDQFSKEVVWVNYVKGNQLNSLNVDNKDAIFIKPNFLTDKENEKQFKKCAYKTK